MTREHSWRRGRRIAALLVVALVLMCIAEPARAQAAGSPAATCTIAGQACFTPEQIQQLTKVGDDVMARRAGVDSSAATEIRQVVDFWGAYSVAIGYAVAFSYLPG